MRSPMLDQPTPAERRIRGIAVNVMAATVVVVLVAVAVAVISLIILGIAWVWTAIGGVVHG